MKYIYEISDGHSIYIGQSSASDNDTFSRVIFHLNCAYGNQQGDESEPGLLAMIRRHNLNKLHIEIFTEPYYGYDSSIFQTFFQFLTPYSHRTTVKNYKSHNDIVTSITSQPVDELMMLDAAEILHIANAIHSGKRVFNAEMGGAYYGWSMIGNPETLVLQKAFKPSEAVRVLDYIDSTLAHTQKAIDQAFQKWLNSANWKEWAAGITLDQRKVSGLSWKEFLFNEVSDWFWNTKTREGSFTDFVKYLNDQHPTITNFNVKLRTPSQIKNSLATVLSETLSYQIRHAASQKTFKSIDEAIQTIFSKHTFTSGKPITLSYAQVFDIEKSGIVASGWWRQTARPTLDETNEALNSRIKWVSYNTMKNIYRQVANPQVYTFRRLISEDPLLAFTEPVHPSLSAKIHAAYINRGITAEIVTDQWRAYYRPMISYIINSYASAMWEVQEIELDEEQRNVAFRENKAVPTPEGSAPVAHTIKGDVQDWLTTSLRQITVY